MPACDNYSRACLVQRCHYLSQHCRWNMARHKQGGSKMPTKPRYLWPDFAAQFKDRSIVEAYRYRAPYPEETFDLLLALVGQGPRSLLDAGCGRGELARPMVARLDRVDAVDFSYEMLEQGKKLPG